MAARSPRAGPDRGVVFQAPSLLPGSRRARTSRSASIASIRTPAARERRDIVDYYLTRVGLADALDKTRAATCRTA